MSVVYVHVPLPWLGLYRFTEPLISTSTRKTSASTLLRMRRACTSLVCITDPPTVHRVNVITIDALHTNCVHGNANARHDTAYCIGSDRTSCLLGIVWVRFWD
jgi:hypothetical protein